MTNGITMNYCCAAEMVGLQILFSRCKKKTCSFAKELSRHHDWIGFFSENGFRIKCLSLMNIVIHGKILQADRFILKV